MSHMIAVSGWAPVFSSQLFCQSLFPERLPSFSSFLGLRSALCLTGHCSQREGQRLWEASGRRPCWIWKSSAGWGNHPSAGERPVPSELDSGWTCVETISALRDWREESWSACCQMLNGTEEHVFVEHWKHAYISLGMIFCFCLAMRLLSEAFSTVK